MKKLRITVEGKVYEVTVQVLEDDEALASTGAAAPAAGVLPSAPPGPPAIAPVPAGRPLPARQPDAILAPIAGTVRKVFVEVGSDVEPQAPVVLLDAMKMDTYIYAPRAFTVTEVAVEPGATVQVGDCLIRFRPRG
jgi:glutaconyl-CoA/methylmalonyl-CoA decarboxylase subunit gamma